jgi:hypothetical protein
LLTGCSLEIRQAGAATNHEKDKTFMKINRLFSGAIGAVLVLGVLPQASSAVVESHFNVKTTEDLYQLCSVEPKDPNYIAAIYACRGFIGGAVLYHDAVSDRKELKRLICYPESATIHDGRHAFVKWAEANKDNQKMMQEVPVVGLVRALAAKYPCSS